MSDFDDALAEVTPPPEPCKLGAILQQVDDASRASVEAALKADVISQRICNALAKMKYPVSDKTVSRHRLGECRCV